MAVAPKSSCEGSNQVRLGRRHRRPRPGHRSHHVFAVERSGGHGQRQHQLGQPEVGVGRRNRLDRDVPGCPEDDQCRTIIDPAVFLATPGDAFSIKQSFTSTLEGENMLGKIAVRWDKAAALPSGVSATYTLKTPGTPGVSAPLGTAVSIPDLPAGTVTWTVEVDLKIADSKADRFADPAELAELWATSSSTLPGLYRKGFNQRNAHRASSRSLSIASAAAAPYSWALVGGATTGPRHAEKPFYFRDQDRQGRLRSRRPGRHPRQVGKRRGADPGIDVRQGRGSNAAERPRQSAIPIEVDLARPGKQGHARRGDPPGAPGRLALRRGQDRAGLVNTAADRHGGSPSAAAVPASRRLLHAHSGGPGIPTRPPATQFRAPHDDTGQGSGIRCVDEDRHCDRHPDGTTESVKELPTNGGPMSRRSPTPPRNRNDTIGIRLLTFRPR